jgi:hypothetical protein
MQIYRVNVAKIRSNDAKTKTKSSNNKSGEKKTADMDLAGAAPPPASCSSVSCLLELHRPHTQHRCPLGDIERGRNKGRGARSAGGGSRARGRSPAGGVREAGRWWEQCARRVAGGRTARGRPVVGAGHEAGRRREERGSPAGGGSRARGRCRRDERTRPAMIGAQGLAA